MVVRCNSTLNRLIATASLLISALPALASDPGQGITLSMRDFDRIIDRAHAMCASRDLEFSQAFYDCLDQKMDGIYIDSSTVRSGR